MDSDNKFKKLSELRTLSTNADDFNETRIPADEELFDRVFLKNEFYDQISNQNRYFIIGEKGSGKTAYAVYFCKNNKNGIAELDKVPSQMFYKFIQLKEKGMLNSTPYNEIWENVILMMILGYIKQKLEVNPLLNFFRKKKINRISQFLKRFHKEAYNPNFLTSFEVVQSYKENSEIGGEYDNNTLYENYGKLKLSNKKSKERFNSETLQNKQSNMALTDLLNESKQIINEVKYRHPIDFFIDGIDILPENVDYETYKVCIEGLANAVINLNADKSLRKLGVRVCLLIRPDLLFDMKLHNGAENLKNNAVYLKWDTANKDYRKSLLFRIADNYLSQQQENPSRILGETWDYYFPYQYKVHHDGNNTNSFVQFLTFSNYKPRDILTLLNFLIEKNKHADSKERFTKRDLIGTDSIRTKYQDYLKNDLKDYMSVYLSNDEIQSFDTFLKNLVNLGIRRRFTYEEFVNAYRKHFENEQNLNLKNSKLSNENAVLQLMYDANLICYFDSVSPSSDAQQHWSLKEKDYSNMSPSVQLAVAYQFHTEFAMAYKISSPHMKKK